jgi:hypothetical protein
MTDKQPVSTRRVHIGLSLSFLFLLFFLLCSLQRGECRETDHTLAEAVSVEVVYAEPNYEDPQDVFVTVRVRIRAADKPVVIPDCAEKPRTEKELCLAFLQRSKGGKWQNAKPAVWAVEGVENPDTWKPLTVEAGGAGVYLYSFSTEFFGIRPGVPLRIAISVWPEGASIKDWQAAETVFSPVFKCPSFSR